VPDRPVAAACRGLSKTYGEGAATTIALRKVDLDIRFGELLMLVGPSGSGKTTLISIIAGILDQDDGECRVLGQNIRALEPAERAAFRSGSIGFVFQAFNLLPTLTIAENVALPLLIRGRPRKEALERALQGLAEVGLAERAEALPAKLSGGQQQRVAVARALVHDPRLIVCDEPTSNLDHTTGHQVMELLRAVARSPERALIVVTHDPRIFDFADRIAHMEDGQILDIIEQPAPGERT
jgi:putative ABC transport system ATP-binding protein